MKRMLLLLVTVLLLVGCTRVPSGATTPTTPPQPAMYEANWAYRYLSADQKRNYAAVYEAVVNGFANDTYTGITDGNKSETSLGLSVDLPVPLSNESEIQELYDAVMQDNPAFFYVGSVYGYEGRQHGDERSFTALKLTYTMSAAERTNARAALEAVRAEIVGTITPEMTDFEKELALHDALTARCRYDTTAAQSNDPLEAYSASFTVYGALVKGKAVCEGYARSMQYLLHAVGIEATVVAGFDKDGTPHMWNAVKPDGELYYLDVTWNDTEKLNTYTYFNLNTEELQRSYRIDERAIGIETATATAQNYYKKTNTYLDTLRIDELASHIAKSLAAGEYAHLRFTDSTYDNALFFVRSTAWFIDTVNACRPEGAAALDKYTFTYNETYKTVTICKKTS